MKKKYPSSYKEAKEMLKALKPNYALIKLDHNTYLEHGANKDTVEISLHGNVIAMIRKSRLVLLHHCNYKTVTTKDRMSKLMQAMGVGHIYQYQHEWYSHIGGVNAPWPTDFRETKKPLCLNLKGKDMSEMKKSCDSCASNIINGVFCHEQSCPRAWEDYDRTCRICGSNFKPTEKWLIICPDCMEE